MYTEERAAVAIAYPGGRTVESVMVENLTLPHQLGEMLVRHYTDRMKIWQLVQLGDILSVGAELGPQVGLDGYSEENYAEFYLLVNLRCVAAARGAGASPQEFGRQEQWEFEHVDCHRYLYNPRIGENGMWLYGEPGFSEKPGEFRTNTMMPLSWSTGRWKRRQRMAKAAAARG